ncbi:Superfamily II DNA or RNA helicase [Pseudomonas aeruginosa]|uniref:DEAD/DEAH box helicase n=2 Tax=Pseudomonas aeruginosa TaxID=287 RepID=UPI0009A739B1|nr:DEAD/DEAH box helicase family protein [Pseudomonas aeruginosa]SKB73831.1 Superfamily II DNA or RNA helicase [Pseudomonas aeruginosa]HCH7783170.1 DEAD/DEAH box helicase family protein [Pseudomonas aeruginosa]HEP9282153.1 DEAD/DEAH box helicase family protein [Pseudomonas aeruginosa]
MFTLPALIFEERYSIGVVRHQIRPALQVSLVVETSINVSAKIKQPLRRFDNEERVIVTSRKDVQLPEGVDGVLLEIDGKFSWARHRLLDEFQVHRATVGPADHSREISACWNGKLRFVAERREPGQTGGGLRPPQLGALHAIGAHWSLERTPATIVMPTGTGKTETMLAVLAAYAREPILVVVPWDALREQTANKFITFGLLRAIGVLPTDVPNPVVGIMKKRPKTQADLLMFEHCNVVVATIGSIGAGLPAALLGSLASRCKALILDEAHHVPATSWTHLKDAFRGVPTLQFTATPFRRDTQLVDGKVIFNYPLGAAQRDDYFKPIRFEPVQVSPLDADRAIAEAAVKQLRNDLDQGLDHLLMARCSSIARATVVAEIYQAIAGDLIPVLIHSESDEAQVRLAALKNREAKIVICVSMLGEGFDLPQLKVAAVHDMHRSLAILLQFVGRFTRVAGGRIGDATVIANIGDKSVSDALERLYSEDADWNLILSEMSSAAARDHAELVAFLHASRRLDDHDQSDSIVLSPHLLRPKFSTAVYRATAFAGERFHSGLPANLKLQAVWEHEQSPTVYFVTRTESRVRWTNTKGVLDCEWALFVLHHDVERGLLYLSSTNHDSLFPELAEAVAGEAVLIKGEQMFRSLGHISRLMLQNIGVKKHGRRNLSFAMYTGGDVDEALGLTERHNSVKNNVSGTGWEEGARVSVGCSVKGRVWSRDQGSIPALLSWCQRVGTKLLDDTINIENIIANVLLPSEIEEFPADKIVLVIEWPAELLGISEDRIALSSAVQEDAQPLYMFELLFASLTAGLLQFALVVGEDSRVGEFELRLDAQLGFKVQQTGGDPLTITIGKRSWRLDEYFGSYPPLVRFIDLSELDGNLLIQPRNPRELILDAAQFEPWDWTGFDLTKESYWKDGVGREDSIQWKVAQAYMDGNFDVVFDDDSAGEAADLVCLKEEGDVIRLAMIHCKFSGASTKGERIKDAVEVCSQAVRSAKWKWRFTDLCRHLLGREERLKTLARPTRFFQGNAARLSELLRQSRFKSIVAEVLIAQPGISVASRSEDQDMVIAAAMVYLKETIGCDLQIICSP